MSEEFSLPSLPEHFEWQISRVRDTIGSVNLTIYRKTMLICNRKCGLHEVKVTAQSLAQRIDTLTEQYDLRESMLGEYGSDGKKIS